MNDDGQRPAGEQPDARINWTSSAAPSRAAAGADPTGVDFRGRTRTKTQALRAGLIAGTGLLVALAAAVAMGASPAAVPSGGASPAASGPSVPEQHDKAGRGWAFGGPGGRQGRGFGQISVTAINGSDLALRTDDGWTRTITVATATTITTGGQPATVSDLRVGDVIRFAETRNADGSYTITRIDIVVPQVAGTVTAIGADSITITGRDGTATTVRTSASTTYHVGRADGSRADVKVGSAIVATGTKAADGSLDAASVTVLQPRVAGTVTATTSSTITISGPNGTTRTIHVSAATTYSVAGASNGSLADVSVGMKVIVEGTARADGSVDASAIQAVRFPSNGGHDNDGLNPDASPAPTASGGTTG